jgi:hypothetical protein
MSVADCGDAVCGCCAVVFGGVANVVCCGFVVHSGGAFVRVC